MYQIILYENKYNILVYFYAFWKDGIKMIYAYENNLLKKVVSWICTLCMILNMLPATALASEPDAPIEMDPQAIIEEVIGNENVPAPALEDDATDLPEDSNEALPEDVSADTNASDEVPKEEQADTSDPVAEEPVVVNEPVEEVPADDTIPDNMADIEPEVDIDPDIPDTQDTPAEDPVPPSLFKDFPVAGMLTSEKSYAEYVYISTCDETILLSLDNPDLLVEVCILEDTAPIEIEKTVDEENTIAVYALPVITDVSYLIRIFAEDIIDEIPYALSLVSESVETQTPDNTEAIIDIPPDNEPSQEENNAPADEVVENEPVDEVVDILPDFGGESLPKDNTAFDNFLNGGQQEQEEIIPAVDEPIAMDEDVSEEKPSEAPADQDTPADSQEEASEELPVEPIGEEESSADDEESLDSFLVTDDNTDAINPDQEEPLPSSDTDAEQADSDVKEEETADEEHPTTDGEENTVSDEDAASSTDETEDVEDSSVNTEEDDQENQETDILKEDSDEDSEASEESEDNADKDSEDGNDESAETEDKDKSEETAEDDADLEIDEETLICEDGVYTYTGHGLTVSVETSEENELPEGSEFVLIPVSAEEPRVQEYVARVAEMHGVDPASVTPYVYDMHFEYEGEEVQIAKESSVNIHVSFDEALNLGSVLAVPFYHAENGELVELIADVTRKETPALRGAKMFKAAKAAPSDEKEEIEEKTVDSFSFAVGSFSDFMLMGVGGTRSVDKYEILYSNGDLVIQEGNTTDPNKGTVVRMELCTDGTMHAFYANYKSSIKNVYFNTTINRTSGNGMFYQYPNLENIYYINNVIFSGSATLNQAFRECPKLKHIDGLDIWDVSMVTQISSLFNKSPLIDNINDIEGWNLTIVPDAYYGVSWAFADLPQLTSLDLSGWDLSQVFNTENMFYRSTNLQTVNLGNLFAAVPSGTNISMKSMFMNCSSLTNVNGFLTNAPASCPIDLNQAFDLCSAYNTEINLSGTTITNMSYAFCQCQSLPSVDLSGCSLSGPADRAFQYCDALTTINLSNIQASTSSTNLDDTFYKTPSLTYLDLSSTFFDDGNKSSTFLYNSGITSITLGSNYIFGNSELKYGTWERESTGETMTASELKANYNSSMADTYLYNAPMAILYSNGDLVFQSGDTIDESRGSVVTSWGTDGMGCFEISCTRNLVKQVYITTNIRMKTSSMFSNLSNLEYMYGVEKIDLSNIASLANFVSGNQKLKHIYGLADMDTSCVTNANSMFTNNSSLDNINDIEGWTIALKGSGLNAAFQSCTQLTSIDLSGWDLSQLTSIQSCFSSCSSLQSVDLGNIFTDCTSGNTMSNIRITLGSAFFNCLNLTSLNDILSNIPRTSNISAVDICQIFASCSKLNIPINLSELPLDNIYGAFSNCHSLQSVDMSGCIMPRTNTGAYNLFYCCYALETVNFENTTVIRAASSTRSVFQNTRSLSYLDLTNGFFDQSGKNAEFFKNSGITRISLGSGFQFESSILPPGIWERESTGEQYSAAELKNIWDSSMADTYFLADLTDYDNKYAIIYSNGDMVFQETNILDPSKGTALWVWLCEDGLFDDRWSRPDEDSNSSTTAMTKYKEAVKRVYFNTTIGATPGKTFDFRSCENLEYIYNIERLDLSNNPNGTRGMFWDCKSLVHVYGLADMDVSNVHQCDYMFNNCNNLENINDIEGWNLTITNNSLISAFSGCRLLETIDLSSWDLSNVSNIQNMFNDCGNIRSVDLGNIFTSATANINMSNTFQYCYSLESISDIISNIPANKTVSLAGTYNYCYSLTSVIDLSGLTITALNSAFNNCKEIKEIYLTGCTLSGSANSAFSNCNSLRILDLNNVTATASSTSLNTTFQNTYVLAYLDLSSKYFDGGSKGSTTFSGSGITKVTLGSGFQFNSSTLPAGNWKRESTGDIYTAAQLKSAWNSSMADTYEKVNVVTFDGMGGTVSQKKISKPLGENIEEDDLPVAELTGYTFLGWFTDQTAGTELHVGDPVAQSIYYAHWQENEYTLALCRNATDETGNIETDIVLTYTETYRLPPNLYQNADKVIQKWSTSSDGSGISYSPDETVSMLSTADNGEVYLYAIWGRSQQATISFDSQGGNDVETIIVERGGTLTTTQYPTPARSGYVFQGWWTDPTDGERWDTEDRTILGSQQLYAHWSQNLTVSFVSNGGWISESTLSVPYGETLSSMPWGSDAPRVLAGFFTDPDFGEGTKLTTSTVITEDSVYYAHWGYQPNFVLNGGSYTNGYSVDTEYPISDSNLIEITSLPTVEYDGHTLNRWKLSDGTTVNIGDVIDMTVYPDITAEWDRTDTVKVTFDPNGGTLSTDKYEDATKYLATVYELEKDTPLGYYPDAFKYVSSKSNRLQFLGWYDDNDVLYTRDTVVTQDVTLHAKYMSDNTIRYEFLVAGSTINPVSQYGNTIMTVSGYKAIVIYKTKGDTFGVPPGVSANIAGKYLEGWYSDPDPYNQDGTLKDGVEKLTSQTAKTENSTWYAYFADETETKHSDNISYKFYADWTNTAASATLTNTDKNLDFHPTSTSNITANLHAHFELLSSVSETLPVGSVRITIPKYVWKDWDGNDAGTVNISSQLPQYPNKKSGMLFSYAEDGEGNYVLLNNVPLSGGAGVDVTLAYTVNPLLVPGGATDRNKDYLPEYPYYSATIPVTMEIDRDIVTEYEQTTTNGVKTVTLTDNFVPDVQDDDSLSLELHTLVDTSVIKSLYGWYYEWQDAWGPRPDDYQDNFYIEWRVTMSRKNNQPFTWKITEDTVHDGTVVSGPTYANGPESVTTGAASYYDSYVNFVIAYPKSLYDDMPAAGKDLLNQAKLTVEWKSGYVQELVASATQHISSWKSSYGEFSKSNVYGSSQSYTPYVFGNYDAAGNKENPSDKYKQNMLVNGETIPLEWELTYDGTSTDQPILWDEDSGSYVRSQRIIAIADGMNGDIMYSSGKTYNKYVWEPSSGNKVLTDEDYRINKIRIYLNEYDGSLHNGEWGGPTLRSDYGVWKDIGVYVRYVNSNDLVFYKSVRPYATQANDVGTTFQNGYTDVVFPANVVGWEIRYPTKYFKTKIKVHEIVEILPTANLRSWIQEDIIGGYTSLIKNRGYCNIWSSDDEYADPGNWNRRYSTNSYDNSTRSATDIFFHATNWKGGFNKANQAVWELKYDKLQLYAYKYTSSQNQVIFDAGQGVQDSVVQIAGKNYNPRSNSAVASISAGRFYDLLPRGTTVDVSTLFGILSRNTNSSQSNNCANYSTLKENTGRHLPKEYYNVEFVEDWEGSGRTMMIIDYTAPTDDTNTAEFFYLLRTTYDDILTYGASMQNDVAFVDLTQSNAYDTYYSTRSYLQNDSYLYENIDLLYDNIAYYYANTNYILVNAFSWGFFKTVNTDDSYSAHEVTIPNNIYTYKLNYTQSELTKTQSMVFFDVLDRGIYDNAFTDPQLSTPTEWSGTFDSIDITPLQSLVKDGSSASNPIYCAPVVYYSTKAKDAFTSSDWDVTNTATWTTTMPDKSLITAVAVDCSKAANGTDFVMKGVNNAVFYVRMVSSADPDDIDKAAVNQAMFMAVVNDLPNEALSSASVTIIDMTPEIHKTSSPTSGTQEAPQALMPGEKLVYTLTATNTNTEFTVPNVVIEDELSTDLQMEADKILIHFGNTENAMPVSSSPRAIMRITGSRIKITINTLQPEETCYITIPARARAAYGHLVENTAVVTSVNGVVTDIESETTYHKINSQIPILKLSSNGSFVVGATLQLWNTDGTDNVLVEEWETANEPHNVCLDAGNYLLTETSAPAGFASAADITFEVQADGTVVFPDTTTASRVVLVDEAVVPVHGTKIWKYDAPADRPDNITIRLMRKLETDASPVYTGISQTVTAYDDWEYDFGNQPRYDLNGDEYTYSIEEAAVSGYTPQYLTGSPDANGLQITFSARTSTCDENDKFTLYYRYGDKVFGKTYFGTSEASTNPAGTTIQIPTNEFWIAFESDASDNDYGFKLDQIIPVQMEDIPTLDRITPPSWAGTAVSEEYTGGVYPESDHNYFVSERILMHYVRSMDGGNYDVINVKDSIGFTIPINKINEDNEKIGGVSLRLTSDPQPGDPEIEPIEWVTEAGETHYVHLYPGRYVLHEVSAVTGYLLADDIAFEVNGQGGIIIDNTELNTLEMLDRYSSQPYPIKKVWMDEGFESRRPASLTFELVRKSDNTVVGTKTLTAEDAASSTVWEGEFDPVPVVDNSYNQIEYFVRETNTLSDYVKVYGLEHVNGFNVTFTADSDIGDGRLYIVLLDSTQETPLEDLQMEGHLTLNPLYGMAYLEADDMAGNTYYVPNRSDLNAIGFYVEWPNGTSTGSLGIASIVPTEETHSYTLATSGQPYPADWSALQNVTMNSTYPNLTTRQAVLGNNVSGGVWYFDMYQSETDFDGSAVVNMIRSDITYEYPVTFSKVKPDNTMLAGAHLKLYTSEETLVSEWDTSASEAHTENLAPGEYVLKETGVPAGYLKAADIAFTVANDGTILVNSTSVQGITMTDALQPTLSVDVVDYDHRNTSLTGASLRLYDSEGETLLTWTSDGTLKDVTSQLQPGHTYTIRELTPPAGYNALTEDIHIQVASDGTITITASDWAELTGNATSGYVLKLLNRNGILFPATGSSDIPIYAAGLLLMIMAMAMVIAKRRHINA